MCLWECVFFRVRKLMLSAVEGILSARSDSLQCCVGSSPSPAKASQVNKGMMWWITMQAQMVCVYTHTHTHTHTHRFVWTCFINIHYILQGFRDHFKMYITANWLLLLQKGTQKEIPTKRQTRNANKRWNKM